jgi:hypothetical protein
MAQILLADLSDGDDSSDATAPRLPFFTHDGCRPASGDWAEGLPIGRGRRQAKAIY